MSSARADSYKGEDICNHIPAVLGSTSNFDFPPEELDKFAKDHNLNGGSAANASTEDDDDDYTESLVYVSSPKVNQLLKLSHSMQLPKA